MLRLVRVIVGDSHQEFAVRLHGEAGPAELAAMEGGQLASEPLVVVAAMHALARELSMWERYVSEVRARGRIVQETVDGSLSIG